MKVLMAHSFKGGSGKTIYTTNLARQLADKGKKVLLIETDFSMPAFHSIFTDIDPDLYLNDFLRDDSTDLSSCIYQYGSIPNLDLVFTNEVYDPTHKVFSRDQNWFRLKKKQLERALNKLDYDYIIFDTTPGMHLFVINLLLLTDVVYILMRSDTQSIRGTHNLINRIYKKTADLGGKVSVNLVINQIPQVSEMGQLTEAISQQFKIQYSFVDHVVIIPFEHQTSYFTAVDQFLLPPANPTFQHIASVIENTDLI